MALATAGDVEVALGRELTDAESERVDYLIRRASSLVVSYLGCDPEDDGDIPQTVTDVTAGMVARVFERVASVPTGATQVQGTAGPFSQNVTFASGSTSALPWLERTDKTELKPYRCGGGLASVQMMSERTGRYRREV